VSLPTWKANVGYEEGENWVLSKMKAGYPRFFIHKSIERLADEIVLRFGYPGEQAILFPSPIVAKRGLDFFRATAPELGPEQVRQLDLSPSVQNGDLKRMKQLAPGLSCVLYPKIASPIAKQVWQHTGEGVSSRRAEFCLKVLEDGLLKVSGDIAAPPSPRSFKGPKRYQKQGSMNGVDINACGTKESEKLNSTDDISGPTDGREYAQFIEERFGRNLDINLAASAKLAVRRRIAGSLVADVALEEAAQPSTHNSSLRMTGFSEDDVYLYPCGMNAIFNTHRTLMAARGSLKSICFG
jgi:cystathionine gamma-synthase